MPETSRKMVLTLRRKEENTRLSPIGLKQGSMRGEKAKNGTNTGGGRSWRQEEAGFFLALLTAARFYTEVLGLAFPFSCYFSPEILTGPALHCHSGSVQMVTSSDGLLMLSVSLNCRSHIMFYFLYIAIEIICISLLCLLQ